MSSHDTGTFFERLEKGLKDSIAHSRGELTLKTTTLPAPPPPASPTEVSSLRHRLRMSQSVFAALLNVSPKLVQSWEQGERKPRRGDLRLLQVIRAHPEVIVPLIGSSRTSASTSKATRPATRRRNSAA